MTTQREACVSPPAEHPCFARAFWWSAAAAMIYLIAFVAWLQRKIGGPDATHVFNDVAGTIPPLLAAATCWRASRRLQGAPRRAWQLFAAATLSWGLGETTWTVYELVFHREVPFPSAADIGYLAFVPLAVAAMLKIPSAPEGVSSRVRTIVDGAIAAGALFVLSWELILSPIYSDASQPLFAKLIGLAYPIGDVAIVAIALPLITRSQRGGRSPLMLVTGGLILLAIADSLFSYLTMSAGYVSGGPLDVLWVASFLIVAVGGVRRLHYSGAVRRDARVSTVLRAVVPLLPLLPIFALAVDRTVEHEPLGDFVMGIVLLFTVLVIGRQLLTLAENIRLARDLETKVEERTAELRASEELSRGIVQTASDAFISTDGHGRILDWSPRAEQMFGWTFAEAIGRPLPERVGPDVPVLYHTRPVEAGRTGARGESRRLEVTAHDRNGRAFPVEVTSWAMHAPDGLRLNAFVRDISERRAFEDQLRHQALHDALTGLPNRVLFEDRVSHALSRAVREGAPSSLLFVDIDDFKTVNDSLGYASGDEVLCEVARRLRDAVRPGDTVARLGGDEFAILLDNPPITNEAPVVAERLVECLKVPQKIGERELALRCRIGIAMATDGITSDQLVRNADTALHRAQANGRRIVAFTPDMHAAMVDKLDIQEAIRAGLARNEFTLFYQPVVTLEDARLSGFEALVRWQHPTRGTIAPGDFIPTAESTGLIVPLGRWVLEEACRQAQEWRRRFPHLALKMNVNLSMKQLEHAKLVEDVEAILARTGILPSSIVLEITESTMTDDGPELVAKLHALRSLGVRIAIDDFGTGYSSLSYLRELPVDILKIDKSFVDGMTTRDEDAEIVRGIVRIAHTLHLDVTAEGIELAEQAAALRDLGCTYGQGYLFSRPLPPDDAESILIEGAHGTAAAIARLSA